MHSELIYELWTVTFFLYSNEQSLSIFFYRLGHSKRSYKREYTKLKHKESFRKEYTNNNVKAAAPRRRHSLVDLLLERRSQMSKHASCMLEQQKTVLIRRFAIWNLFTYERRIDLNRISRVLLCFMLSFV